MVAVKFLDRETRRPGLSASARAGRGASPMQLKKQWTDKIRFTSHSLPSISRGHRQLLQHQRWFPFAAFFLSVLPDDKTAIESPLPSLCLLVRRPEEDTFP